MTASRLWPHGSRGKGHTEQIITIAFARCRNRAVNSYCVWTCILPLQVWNGICSRQYLDLAPWSPVGLMGIGGPRKSCIFFFSVKCLISPTLVIRNDAYFNKWCMCCNPHCGKREVPHMSDYSNRFVT